MNSKIFIILLIVSCQNVTRDQNIQKNNENTNELKVESALQKTNKLVANSFLENMIDFQKFKEVKSLRFTTTVTQNKAFYFTPEINDSIYYLYNYLPEKYKSSFKEDNAIVFKYGKNQHTYEDDTEILLELSIYNEDSNLGSINLVGLSQTDLISKFGSHYEMFDNFMVYSNKQTILLIELNNSKAQSFRYIKLNTEIINQDLINQILNSSDSKE
jgi:hypothetical protein